MAKSVSESFGAGDPVEVIPSHKRHRSEAAWEPATYQERASLPRGSHWVYSTLHGRLAVPACRIRRAVSCRCGHFSSLHDGRCLASACQCQALVVDVGDPGLSSMLLDLSSLMGLADEVEASPDRATRRRVALALRALISEIRANGGILARLEDLIAGGASPDALRRDLILLLDDMRGVPTRRFEVRRVGDARRGESAPVPHGGRDGSTGDLDRGGGRR